MTSTIFFVLIMVGPPLAITWWFYRVIGNSDGGAQFIREYKRERSRTYGNQMTREIWDLSVTCWRGGFGDHAKFVYRTAIWLFAIWFIGTILLVVIAAYLFSPTPG